MSQPQDSTTDVPPITSVMFEGPGIIGLQTRPSRPLEKDEFFVRTLYSGISAGTELTFFMGTNPHTNEGWDKERRIFRGDIEPTLRSTYPKRDGYMESAVVTQSRNPNVLEGTRIAGKYGHADGYIMTADDFWVPLPDDLDEVVGIWANQMGPICMNGILYAADEVQRKPLKTLQGSLTGQRVIVFGAGIVGLLCGMFAKWAGASEVIIIDAIAERLNVAEKLGLSAYHASVDLPIVIKDHWRAEKSEDSGADITLQCTGSTYLLSQALSCLKVQGTVIDLGFYQQGAHDVFLGKEFHHNILRHVCAQIGKVPYHQQGPWNRQRLSEETIAFLREQGGMLKRHLITHEIPFSKAQQMFERLEQRDPTIMQAVLFPDK
ncbi:MAG TPA: zinc-binding alcohol dehydrogenase [Candidatus Saccharimonadales bacterium]|nr:zinc-binding alcohol dehydrogenase [Candidatus Saccharimonadales bacterium]